MLPPQKKAAFAVRSKCFFNQEFNYKLGIKHSPAKDFEPHV